MRHGVPLEIIALTAHTYLGPRRVRVRSAVSRCAYPRRSVLAGCTWATVHIRVMLLEAAERFVGVLKEEARRWEVTVSFFLYIDDAALACHGSVTAVAHVMAWAARLLVRWLTVGLGKPIARHKLQCIASGVEMRRELQSEIGDFVPVKLHGELLGVDISMGGRLRRRPIQSKRFAAARARKRKLRWWRRIGGGATRVARGGACPQATYGADVVGIPPAAMRDLRRIQAAASRVSCGGSSLTAKLALGGRRFEEIDPAVLDVNMPLMAIIRRTWDVPQARHGVALSWLAASRDVEQHGEDWRRVAGPVHAALLGLLRVGARWPRPFTIELLDEQVDFLRVPPVQCLAVLRAHARRHLDRRLIERAADGRGAWDKESVVQAYVHGVDWGCVRDVLNSGFPSWQSNARSALEVVTCGGAWCEDRRWRCGYLGQGTCAACFLELGTDAHHWHSCGAMLADTLFDQLAGHVEHPRAQITDDPSLAPLAERGWPPVLRKWAPADEGLVEGDASGGHDGETYGDGSGHNQDSRENRVATWSIARLGRSGDEDGGAPRSWLRGRVGGWHPTVPRGEILALIWHLRKALTLAVYVGDCLHVIRAACEGVPPAFTGSRNPNADLWQEVLRLLKDHGEGLTFLKTKAHRSRAEALRGGDDEPMRWWHGNRAADFRAKQLSRSLADAAGGEVVDSKRKEFSAVLRRLGHTAAWTLRRLPDIGPRPRRRAAVVVGSGGGGCGDHALVPRERGE